MSLILLGITVDQIQSLFCQFNSFQFIMNTYSSFIQPNQKSNVPWNCDFFWIFACESKCSEYETLRHRNEIQYNVPMEINQSIQSEFFSCFLFSTSGWRLKHRNLNNKFSHWKITSALLMIHINKHIYFNLLFCAICEFISEPNGKLCDNTKMKRKRKKYIRKFTEIIE